MEAENRKKPRCTVKADLELLRRYWKNDQQALDKLMSGHIGLIYFWVGKVLRRVNWADPDDLRQEGCVGFIEAAQKYETSQHVNFHSFARVSVRAAVYRSREVSRVTPSLYKNYRKVMKAQAALMQKLNRRPTLEEIARETNLTENQVDTALNALAAFPSPLEEDGRGESEDPQQIDIPYQQQLIKDAGKHLSSYQAQIIKRYYFYGQTDAEIAAVLGKTENAIKEARQRALKKLRKIIGGDCRDGT